MDYVADSQGVPVCSCGGRIKPDVVLYEEGLDNDTIQQALYEIRHADMLIVGGTSLVVYPAAGMVDVYNGHRMVLINMSPTGKDSQADLVVKGKIGEILGEVVD